MQSIRRGAAFAGLLLLSVHVAGAAAQESPRNVISANPFGLLVELTNAEFEHAVSPAATAGVGGSWYNRDGSDYVNADAFYRYYPQGRALQGWAFGGKVGLTKVTDSGTYFGYGFDANHSWLLGRNNSFYVGIGFGLKRLVGVDEADDLPALIPTFRIVNVGYAF